MSIEKERVQPAPFEAATPIEKPAEADNSREAGPSGWALPALIVLVVLAIAVVFWLPSALDTSDRSADAEQAARDAPADRDGGTGAPGTTRQQEAPAGTPFADAEAARLRGEAQDILGKLLDLRDSLARKGADIWAPEALDSVNAEASAGDALYRQREFQAAIERYQAALDQARALDDRIPEELESRLETAETALQSGDADSAEAALDVIDKLEPGLEQATRLRKRLETLPEVLARLEEAAEAEDAGDLETAKTLLEAATQADAEHRKARDELARVSSALTAQRFASAMSTGYTALEEERFDDARAAFRRAGNLRKDSGDVATALEEVNVAETARKLRQLQDTARRNVENEKWGAAVKAYESALEIDSSVLFAQRGIQEARTRAELDRRLRAIIDDPDRLADTGVADGSSELLDYARRIEARGPVLQEQISTLAELIERANTPIEITLVSDNQTEVTLLKVSRLGQFERQDVTLRPGEYTAVGTRRGYRDVRETFRVSHDDDAPTVTVICTESI